MHVIYSTSGRTFFGKNRSKVIKAFSKGKVDLPEKKLAFDKEQVVTVNPDNRVNDVALFAQNVLSKQFMRDEYDGLEIVSIVFRPFKIKQ